MSSLKLPSTPTLRENFSDGNQPDALMVHEVHSFMFSRQNNRTRHPSVRAVN